MGIAKEVCRIEKIKSVGALGSAYEHNLRLKDIINADETRTEYNIEMANRSCGKTYVDCFHEKIAKSAWYQNDRHKIAKNAIYAVEFMLTFGNEAKGKVDIEAWCKDNIEWLEKHFGGADNVVSAILHLDERTPHIHAIVIPLDEKEKLNYTKYLGGSKYRLSELQDCYHAEVGSKHNLDRGDKGSKSRHQDVDNFYSMVNETVAIQELPEPVEKEGFFKKGETAKEYQERIAPLVQKAQSVALAKQAENKLLKQRIANIEHLQEGVVPAEDYQKLEQDLSEIKQELKREKRDSQFHRNWAIETQQKLDEQERSFPQKITEAVKKATESLQELYDSLLDKYHILKRKFDKLSADYDILSDSYDEIRDKYNRLQESSSNIEQMKYDWELMYVMLDNRGLSEKFKKCRDAHLNGYTSMEEQLEFGKQKSNQHNQQRQISRGGIGKKRSHSDTR